MVTPPFFLYTRKAGTMNDEKIAKLASALNTTAEKVWEIMLRQAEIKAIYGGAFFIFEVATVCACVYFIYFVIHNWNDLEENSHNGVAGHYAAAAFLAGLCIFVFAIHICVSFESLVAAVFSPEYWAIWEIAKILSKAMI